MLALLGWVLANKGYSDMLSKSTDDVLGIILVRGHHPAPSARKDDHDGKDNDLPSSLSLSLQTIICNEK
jgi:hypothetical protein